MACGPPAAWRSVPLPVKRLTKPTCDVHEGSRERVRLLLTLAIVDDDRQFAAPGRSRAADVAGQAGVSISTVSLVVNDKWRGRVAEPTAQRVLDVVDRLGYVVHESARRLATGASAAVAIIAPAFTNPFYSKVSLGAAGALGGRYQLVFPVPERDGDHMAMLARVLAMGLDGAIIASPTAEVLAAIPDDFPVVVLDAPEPIPGRTRVNLDVRGGTVAVANLLRSLGHMNVAYLDGRPETPTLVARRSALQNEFPSLVVFDEFASPVDTLAAWLCATHHLPALVEQGITAVVCCTDLHAYGVMRALADLGIRVPHDVSVVGFDDQPLSAFITPALTTVSFPAQQLGALGADLLVELIERPALADDPSRDDSISRDSPERLLTAELVVRGSTSVAVQRP
ncbi:MAG: hypothetical protein RLZZ623_566 [Actinomycetota bacterium]